MPAPVWPTSAISESGNTTTANAITILVVHFIISPTKRFAAEVDFVILAGDLFEKRVIYVLMLTKPYVG